MNSSSSLFDVEQVIHKLRHYLPEQAPLKDFVHHNTLHAFQNHNFHSGLLHANRIFGYKVYSDIEEYRSKYDQGKIDDKILTNIIIRHFNAHAEMEWKEKLIHKAYVPKYSPRIGTLREKWKSTCKINLDKYVHPTLFRIIAAYLDQGISTWQIPQHKDGFIASIKNLERYSLISFFNGKKSKELLFHAHLKIENLLDIIVGKKEWYEQYLFDSQFAHPGWSGMVSVIENQPSSLLDKRHVSLNDFILLELLLEIDVLESKFGADFHPLNTLIGSYQSELFDPIVHTELDQVLSIWQEALEWTFFDSVLKGLENPRINQIEQSKEFQAFFCIDDRESSLRTYLEKLIDCETFGTAGFFNIPFYFQPEHGKFHTKVCPSPLTPSHLIIESDAKLRHKKDSNFDKRSNGVFGGWVISQTMGFLSVMKLTTSIFKPTDSPATVSSFRHMDPNGKLSIEAKEKSDSSLQLGFTLNEMADKLEGLFQSTGLVNFTPLVYFIGHGASSVNNTYYAGYDCGACSGRAGSVNARVAAEMSNRKEVREILANRGINIPQQTQFIGGLHDTTRDEIEFYDLHILNDSNKNLHLKNIAVFNTALSYNAKERSRRFLSIQTKDTAKKVHQKVKLRSLSLFEPRPEWNHATNALCIVGPRKNNATLFLDRRAFLQSYDYKIDQEGTYLLTILKAVAPVCGGINLEYYFSKTDNDRLGSGSKLPHNVIGLIGVNNGMEGDLRPGLPMQMVNIHDPLRLMVTVEHYPQVVLATMQRDSITYEWFKNEWIWLVAIHPDNHKSFVFRNGAFEAYSPISDEIQTTDNIEALIESSHDNISVHLID